MVMDMPSVLDFDLHGGDQGLLNQKYEKVEE
jgi:hypothetical protein